MAHKHGVEYIPKQLLLSLAVKVKEQLMSLEIVRSHPDSMELLKKITQTHGKVRTIEDTLTSIGNFQDLFMRMHRVFATEEVRNALPVEKLAIDQAFRAWASIAQHFMKDLQLWEAIDTESYRNRIEAALRTVLAAQ